MSSSLYTVFSIAVILITTKLFGLLMRKLGLPQVLGSILAGILIGKAIWGLFIPSNDFFPLDNTYISAFAEIGVILVLFSAGLETNLTELRKSGLVATLVALGGVILPLILGTGVGMLFVYPHTKSVLSAVFIGVIMCATSVGITVETLRELGKLNSKVGTIIVSAAIIDDVLGIIVLTIFMSLVKNGGVQSSPVLNLINPNGNAAISILWMGVYFILAIGGGILISKLFKKLSEKHPDTHRLPIYSIAVCFIYAFVAEAVFGVADITGAYIAGVVLSTNHRCAEYVDKKVAVSSFMFFGPIFFANIGMQISFSGFTLDILWFGLLFVAAAIFGKIIGCGLTAKAAKFSFKDSMRIGVGMIARGEVALVVAQKGINSGLMDSQHLTVVVMLVLISSVLCPVVLKALYKDKSEGDDMLKANTLEVNDSIEAVK